MFLKKFYAPDPDFSGATLDDVKIVDRTAPQPVTQTETVTAEPEQAPIVDTPATVETSAAVTPEVTAAPQLEPIAPPPAEPKEATPPVVQKNWEDLLKDEGFDDKDLAMLKHRKNTGSYKDYLEAMSVDFKQMQPEEIMRRDLREQYPNMSPENFERLARKQITEKYNLDSDLSPSEEDTALGREMMAHDAESKRQKFIEKQNTFVIPDKDIAGEQQRQIAEQQRIAAEQQQAFNQSIIQSPVAQNLVTKKQIAFDAGDGTQFNYEVDNPQDVMDMLLKPEKYGEAMSTKDAAGNIVPDIQKTMLLATIIKNPQAVFKALINHGKNLGKKEYIDTLENAEKGSGVTPSTEGETFAQAMLNRSVNRNW